MAEIAALLPASALFWMAATAGVVGLGLAKGGFAGLGVPIMALAASAPVAAVQMAVGVIAAGFGVPRLRAERAGAAPRPRRAAEAMGAAAGFASPIADAGGPPFQMHVLPLKLSRDAFIGTMAAGVSAGR